MSDVGFRMSVNTARLRPLLCAYRFGRGMCQDVRGVCDSFHVLFVMVFGLPGASQLRPDVARLRRPGGILRSRYLHFSHIQPSMAVGADVLDLRTAELQRAAPGA